MKFHPFDLMAKSLVKKNIIKHGGGWVLVLILVAHAILSTLGSPQNMKGGHDKLSCHIVTSLNAMHDVPFGYLLMSKWFVMSYCHFIETHK